MIHREDRLHFARRISQSGTYFRRSATMVICMSLAWRTTCCTTVSRKRFHRGGDASGP